MLAISCSCGFHSHCRRQLVFASVDKRQNEKTTSFEFYGAEVEEAVQVSVSCCCGGQSRSCRRAPGLEVHEAEADGDRAGWRYLSRERTSNEGGEDIGRGDAEIRTV